MHAGTFLIPSLIAFIAVLVMIPAMRRLALKSGYVDTPGGRKDHAEPTPPIGGIILFPVFILVSLFSGIPADQNIPYWAGLAVIVIAGALDDRFSLKPRWKFLAQFMAAGLIVWGGAQVAHLGNLLGFGTLWLGFMHIPFSVIAAVLLINAVNLMDGLDGLAGGKSLVALFWFLVCALFSTSPAADNVVPSLLILIACVTGFLFYNMRSPLRDRATVFLGDAGSMGLGLSLAWFGMTLGHGNAPIAPPITVAWILALPIMDTCAQFARRVAHGRHPFDADRNHFHHHFINAGVSAAHTSLIIAAMGVALGAVGFTGIIWDVPEYVLAYLWIALILTHIYLNLRPARIRRIVFAILKRKDG